MTGVLVDSSVIIDVLTGDPRWGQWSADALARAAAWAPLVINPIVFAEVSMGFDTAEEAVDACSPDRFRWDDLPWEAAFLAGRSFLAYRRRGGTKQAPLPDFYIGAHAAVLGYRLLTRDPARVRHAFPTVDLIAPATEADADGGEG